MEDEILREEAAGFFPGRNEMTEEDMKAAIGLLNRVVHDFRPREIEPEDYADLRLPGCVVEGCRGLCVPLEGEDGYENYCSEHLPRNIERRAAAIEHEIRKTYTEAEMICAYVHGAKRMYLGLWRPAEGWTEHYQRTAEVLARELLVEGRLGKD
jgi:uncharacterized protein (UPF0147 family)